MYTLILVYVFIIVMFIKFHYIFNDDINLNRSSITYINKHVQQSIVIQIIIIMILIIYGHYQNNTQVFFMFEITKHLQQSKFSSSKP